MANTFIRKPIPGGDEDAWAPYNDAQNENSYGVNTCKLYDDAGALKLTIGRIGINDGTNEGVCNIDTVTTIDIALCSNSNWCKIEMSVSGTSVTFEASDIAGATNKAVLPTGFTGLYRGDRGGFYITATKRTIGIAWKNAGGTLEGIVNVGSFIDSYFGYNESSTYKYIFYKTIDGNELNEAFLPIGAWNMDTTATLYVAHGLDWEKIKSVFIFIYNDPEVSPRRKYPIYHNNGLGSVGMAGYFSVSETNIEMTRVGLGALFNSVNFDSVAISRGDIYIEYEV